MVGIPHSYNANVADWFTPICEAATGDGGTVSSRTSSDQLGWPGSNLPSAVCGVMVAVVCFIWLNFFHLRAHHLHTFFAGNVVVHVIHRLIAI